MVGWYVCNVMVRFRIASRRVVLFRYAPNKANGADTAASGVVHRVSRSVCIQLWFGDLSYECWHFWRLVGQW